MFFTDLHVNCTLCQLVTTSSLPLSKFWGRLVLTCTVSMCSKVSSQKPSVGSLHCILSAGTVLVSKCAVAVLEVGEQGVKMDKEKHKTFLMIELLAHIAQFHFSPLTVFLGEAPSNNIILAILSTPSSTHADILLSALSCAMWSEIRLHAHSEQTNKQQTLGKENESKGAIFAYLKYLHNAP